MTSTSTPLPQNDGLTRIGQSIALAVRNEQEVAVLIVRIEKVERLCSSIGHTRAAGFLNDFFVRLKSIARENDIIERIGDYRFAVVLNGLKNRGHVALAAKKIERLLGEGVQDFEILTDLATTIGVALCPSQGEDPSDLLRFAEIASLDGRQRNQAVYFYERDSAEQLFEGWGLTNRLQCALESGQLEIHYQPKICIRSNEIIGAEALMRWHDPDVGQISPDIFISLAETAGLISDLTEYAIQSASRQLATWRQEIPGLKVAVNITPSTIRNYEIVELLRSAIGIWDIDPGALTLEITENALMADRDTSHGVLMALRKLGVRISIDDFGTGYSSLSYLKEITADELKIDRSFVMGMLDDPGDFKIVEHTVNIARSFGLTVVAEGVESREMLVELDRLGCDQAQGFYICKPVTAAEFKTFFDASAKQAAAAK